MLQDKFNFYLSNIKTFQDDHGFIGSDGCDSLLWTGLSGCVPDIKVDIDSAFYKVKDEWHRRPCENPCFPNHSASTISKDMLIGLAWYAYFNRRLDISEGIIKHALSHWCIMGEAKTLKDKFGACLLTPGLLATYAEISYRLGGPNRWWLRYFPQYESSSVVDFQAHLSVLHIYLRKLMGVKIGWMARRCLKSQYKRQPHNALFALANDDKFSAAQLLDVEMWWPTNRLPSTAGRGEMWLHQRDYGKDWKPNLTINPPKVFSGADLLFAYWLLTRK